MPQINFRGVKSDDVKDFSKVAVDELADICNTSRDNFIFEKINNSFYEDGKEIELYPLIEVKMFDRGRKIEENMYLYIKKYLENKGYKDIEVYFIKLNEESYFY